MNETNPADMKKKCMICSYEGVEIVCPNDGMLLEETCPTCGQCLSVCICEKNDPSQQKEVIA